MPNIIYAGSASAPGASVSFSSTLDLEGINYMDVTVPGTSDPTTPGTVTVNLGAAAGTLKLLAITGTALSEDLTYQLNATGDDLVLDQPLLLAGAGALDAYATVTSIKFSNTIATDVALEILVGRDPTS